MKANSQTTKPNMLSRRHFLKMAAVTTAGVGLAACAPQTVTVEVTKEVEVVVTPTPGEAKFSMLVPGKPDEPTAKAHTAAIEEYKQLRPNVTIEPDFQSFPEDTQVIPWLAAGSAPDTFRWALDRGPQLGLKNLLVDLAPIAQDLGIVDKFTESVWKGYMWRDGQVWVLPSDVNTFAMWYNPVLFERAGIPDKIPVKTWDDLVAAAEAIAKPDPDPNKAVYGFGRATTIAWAAWWHQWWVWREGSELYDGKELVFKDAMIESMNKVKSLVDKNLLPAFDNWQDTWYAGRLGMQEYGQWVIAADVPGPWNDNKPQGSWKADYERPTFVTSTMFSQKEGVPGYSVLAGFGYYVPKTNKFPTETVEYLWYQQSDPKHGQMFVTPYNQLPAVKEEIVTHPWMKEPVMATFVEQLKTAKPMTVYPEINQFYDECMAAPLIAAFTGKKTVETAVDEMLSCGAPIVREAQAER